LIVALPAVAALLVAACGARTGLFQPEATRDASVDAPTESGIFDVTAECSPATYCDQSDPQHVYSCGQPVQQCGLLEQCEEREDSAGCVNPCLDSLGNDTSNGCEFYAVEMDMTPQASGVCYAVFVVNQWKTGEAAKIQVSLGGKVLPIEHFARIPVGKGTNITYAPFDAEAGLATNQIAILFLSRDPNHSADPDASPGDPALLADCPQA
jgi:hypothetical protein